MENREFQKVDFTAKKTLAEIQKYAEDNLVEELEDLDIDLDSVLGVITTQLITISSLSGLGGGQSKKTKNIVINWKKIFTEVPESYLTLIGAYSSYILLAVAGLAIAIKIKKLDTIEISEKHAITLTAFWKEKDGNNVVAVNNLLETVNSHFNIHTRQQLAADELSAVIDELARIQAIRLNRDGTITIIEEVVCA